MSVLDRVPDYGERFTPDGEPVDEFCEVLARIPTEVGVDAVMIAGVIANYRCTGRGDLAGMLKRWHPEGTAIRSLSN